MFTVQCLRKRYSFLKFLEKNFRSQEKYSLGEKVDLPSKFRVSEDVE